MFMGKCPYGIVADQTSAIYKHGKGQENLS